MLERIKDRITSFFGDGKLSFSDYLPFGNQLYGNNWASVEINSDYIKFLKIHQLNNQYQIEHSAMVPLKSGLVVKNEIKDIAAIAKILKSNFQRLKVNTKNIVLSVNYSSIITKTINVNSHLTTDEIETRVWQEANTLFPNMIKDIFLDFVILGISQQDTSQLEILLVACRKVHVKPYLDVMRAADLDLKVIDVNCYALERSLATIKRQFPQPTLALLNVGFSLITLIIVHENNLNYTYELVYDGHSLMNNINNESQSETTELLKKNLSLHLKHTLQFFYTSRPQIRIEQIILSGDCAAVIPNMEQFIQEETGKQTMICNPFIDMTFAAALDNEKKEKIMKSAPAFMQCCGLSLYKTY